MRQRPSYRFECSMEEGQLVERAINPETGIVVSETWTLPDRRKSRVDGPGLIQRDDITGVVITEGWYLNNLSHRAGGPALITRDAKTGNLLREVWWIEGRRSRQEGPCILGRDPTTGAVIHELWQVRGQTHRLDGPAMIWRDADGSVMREEWWRDGICERYLQSKPFAPLQPFRRELLDIPPMIC